MQKPKGDIIFLGTFGSHLYGTNVASSDNDFQGVFKNPLEEIVLGRSKDNIDESDKINQKNEAGDLDKKWKELRVFINACLSGQAFAMDMIFTPKHLWLESSPIWEEIHSKRHSLVNSNIKPFISYCREQSLKYSKKGDKLIVLDTFLKRFETYGSEGTVTEFFNNNLDLLELRFVERYDKIIAKNNNHPEDYFDIVRSSCPGNRKLKELIRNVKDQYNGYGNRSIKAMEDGGIDLKAYYHALRVVWELEEYLLTGELVFPSPKRDILLKIRNGEFSKEYVEEWIDSEIERVKLIPNNLPEPNYEYWDNWIMETYINEYSARRINKSF